MSGCAAEHGFETSPFAPTVLVLVPHPDDEVVGVAAAIVRAREQGCRVLAAYLTDGVPAALDWWPWARMRRARRVARRWAEAVQVRADLGVESVLRQDLPTRALRHHVRPTLDRLLALVSEFEVQRVWAPAYEGGHQDHDVCSFIASRLTTVCEVWEFPEYHFDGGRVGTNRFIHERGDEWCLKLDAAAAERKRALLGVYRSERGNLGYVGVRQECLRPIHAYDYRVPPHAGCTFYQRFQWVPWHPRIDYTVPETVCATLAALERDLVVRP